MKKSEIKSIIRECLKDAILQEATNRKVVYGQLDYGQLEQYAPRRLMNDKELPVRIDYQPKLNPNVRPGATKPEQHQNDLVLKNALKDLSKITVDDVPLTELYDWKLEISSHNPFGSGSPIWHYYVVGTRKEESAEKNSLGQTPNSNADASVGTIKENTETIEIASTNFDKWLKKSPSIAQNLAKLRAEKEENKSSWGIFLYDNRGNKMMLVGGMTPQNAKMMLPQVKDEIMGMIPQQSQMPPGGPGGMPPGMPPGPGQPSVPPPTGNTDTLPMKR